jgi:hypothetical protein
MFNPLDLFKSAKKLLTTTLVFEVTDDPTESPEDFDGRRPVCVWLLVSEEATKLPLPRENFTALKGSIFVGQITKATAQEVRSISTADLSVETRPYDYVLAEPTKEWEEIYGPRQSVVRIRPTRSCNISVSLPRLKTSSSASASTRATNPGGLRP